MRASTTGTVAMVHVQEGATVETGAALVTVAAEQVTGGGGSGHSTEKWRFGV